jgi:hypothetical protein
MLVHVRRGPNLWETMQVPTEDDAIRIITQEYPDAVSGPWEAHYDYAIEGTPSAGQIKLVLPDPKHARSQISANSADKNVNGSRGSRRRGLAQGRAPGRPVPTFRCLPRQSVHLPLPGRRGRDHRQNDARILTTICSWVCYACLLACLRARRFLMGRIHRGVFELGFTNREPRGQLRVSLTHLEPLVRRTFAPPALAALGAF